MCCFPPLRYAASLTQPQSCRRASCAHFQLLGHPQLAVQAHALSRGLRWCLTCTAPRKGKRERPRRCEDEVDVHPFGNVFPTRLHRLVPLHKAAPSTLLRFTGRPGQPTVQTVANINQVNVSRFDILRKRQNELQIVFRLSLVRPNAGSSRLKSNKICRTSAPT